MEGGWVGFFSILRLKPKHFLGQPSVAFDVSGIGDYNESEGWAALTAPFGLGAAEGKEVSSEANTPSLSGKVEVARSGEEMSMIVLITEPGSGICQFFAVPMGGQTYFSVRFFLFGERFLMEG